ncbi:MAG: FHA domain-containing protein [Acidobacteriota bacterium]
MREDLGQIDASMIADLARIKKEEELLSERLARMEAGKQKVSAKVFTRVREDYQSRQAAFQKESRPLQDRARAEYRKLRGIRGAVEASLEEVALEKEELEFRRDLGEYAAGQFEERLRECDQRLADRKSELERVDAIGREFVAAFHSEKDLETPADEAPAAPAAPAMSAMNARSTTPASNAPPAPQSRATAPAPAAAATAPPPGGDATAIRSAPSLSIPSKPRETPSEALRVTQADAPSEAGNATVIGPGGGPKPAPADSADATRIDARPAQATSRPLSAPALPTSPAPPPAGPPGATKALPRPRLIIPTEGAKSREHVLSPGVTSIGRSPKSDLCLSQSEVSRHHADIAFGPDGYSVIDMGSPNGIFVNGKRVKEHLLAEGDVILIGMQKLTYRA